MKAEDQSRMSQGSLDRRLAKVTTLLSYLDQIEARTGEVHRRRSRLESLRNNLIELGAVPGAAEPGELKTPSWIQEHLAGHGGGWFYPITVTRGHPAAGSDCGACDENIIVGDVVFIMPFHGEQKSRWLVQHRLCTARQFFGQNAEEILEMYRTGEKEKALIELAKLRLDEHMDNCVLCRMDTEALCPEGASLSSEVQARLSQGKDG